MLDYMYHMVRQLKTDTLIIGTGTEWIEVRSNRTVLEYVK